MKRTKAPWLSLMLTLAIAIGISTAAVSAHAASCVAGTWQSPPNSDWDSVNRAFPVQAESAHFQIRWPSDKPNLITRDQTNAALAGLENILSWFTGSSVRWPEPFCDSAVKYKIQIFSNDGYGLSGSGGGTRSPAMWVGPGALVDVGRGLNSGMVHEFTHSMQFHSRGMRDTQFGGWLWESHAEFMAHQYPGNPDKTGCSSVLAWMPHLYYGSTRNRYCNWQFWDFLKNKYGFPVINNMFLNTAGQAGQDPLAVLMRNQGWSATLLGDEFGQFAMKNVNWDYSDAQDGFNRGASYRAAYGPNTDVGKVADYSVSKRLRLARMEAIDTANRHFVVSKYFAPQRYGYNIVRLIPDAGASKITVDFRGVVQSSIAPGAEVGTGAYQPGASPDWVNFAMPKNPASNWRWGLVAIDQNGNARYSAMQRGASAVLDFAVQPGDLGIYLAVAATPDDYHSIFWDQMYHTLYRYPYRLQLTNAMPDGYQAGYQTNVANGFPVGHKHANGGGWVADAAQVDASAYVGPHAAVLGGKVLGSARIEDYAVVWNGTVQDNAVVGGLTQLNANMTVANRARVHAVMAGAQTFDGGTVFNGSAVLFGDLETHLGSTPVSKGAYSGFLDNSLVVKPEIGANRTAPPVEVTAPLPSSWPIVLPSDTVECATEWQTCTMPDSRLFSVYYGANGSYAKRTGISGSISCANNMFGDPVPGTPKRCFIKAESSMPTLPAPAPTPSNTAPKVSLTAPANNISYAQGAVITFTINATDSEGTVTRVELLDNGNVIGTDSSAPFGLTSSNIAVGKHVFTVRAFDDKGASTTSAGINVTINASSTLPPSGAVRCANQNGACALPSGKTATVWYGARSSYKVRTGMTGSVACNNSTFGGDPIWYASKACYYVRH